MIPIDEIGRQGGQSVVVAVRPPVAVGVNADGRREVLGMDIGPAEAETFWTVFLRKLARRGLRGVKLVVSKVLSATWQRCRVPFMGGEPATSPLKPSHQ